MHPAGVKLMTKPSVEAPPPGMPGASSSGPSQHIAGGVGSSGYASLTNLKHQRFKLLDGRLMVCKDSVATLDKLLLDSPPPAAGCPVGYGVVGVLGCQGVGKSTIASYLSGGQPATAEISTGSGGTLPAAAAVAAATTGFDVFDHDRFLEARHCTDGIDLRVNPAERLVVLDSQAVLSVSVLLNKLKQGSANGGTASTSGTGSTMLSGVCNVVVVAVDSLGSGTDRHFLRLLTLATDILQPSTAPTHGGEDGRRDDGDFATRRHLAEVVVAINKCPQDQLFSADIKAKKADTYLAALLPDAFVAPSASCGVDNERGGRSTTKTKGLRVVRLPYAAQVSTTEPIAPPGGSAHPVMPNMPLFPPPPGVSLPSTGAPSASNAAARQATSSSAGHWTGPSRSYGSAVAELVALVLSLATPPLRKATAAGVAIDEGRRVNDDSNSARGLEHSTSVRPSAKEDQDEPETTTIAAASTGSLGPPGLAGPFIRPLLAGQQGRAQRAQTGSTLLPGASQPVPTGADARRDQVATERDWLAASTELWRNLHQVLADPSWAAQAKETSRRGDANVKKAMDSVQEGVGSLDSASPPADAAERLAVYLRVLMGGVSGAA